MKIRASLLTFLLLLFNFILPAQTFEVNGIKYNIVSDTKKNVEVSQKYYPGNITIPASVNYNSNTYKVVGIGANAFNGQDELSSVTLPNSIVYIDEYAFRNSGISSITLPNTLEEIRDGAFLGVAINSIKLNEGLKSIGIGAFAATYLNSIDIPVTLLSIGTGAFNTDADYFEYNVHPSNNFFSTYEGALYDKSQTTLLHCKTNKRTLTIPASVTTIDKNAFGTGSANYIVDKINCLALNPPTNNATNLRSTSLCVPNNAISTYSEAKFWKDLLIQPILPDGANKTTLTETTFDDWAVGGFYEDAYKEVTYSFWANEGEEFSFNWELYSVEDCITKLTVKVNEKLFSIKSKDYGDNGNFSFMTKTGYYNVTLQFSVYGDANGDRVKVTDVKLSNSVCNEQLYSLDDWTSPSTNDDSYSLKTYNFTCESGASLSFDWCTSTELNNDILSCYLDGENILTKSGHDSGTFLTTMTSSGCHSLQFIYSKNYKYKTQEDKVSINNLKIENSYDNYAKLSTINIKEGIPNYHVYEDCVVDKLTYSRTLPNLYWNPLYVPFEISYESIKDKYEVAYINDIHSYDRDDNGEIDEMLMEIVKVKFGTLNANYPYLIKARNEEAKDMNISIEDATLYETLEKTKDCTTFYHKFEITGSYSRKSSQELAGKLAISLDGAWQPLADNTYLNPFRLYMTITDREDSPLKVTPSAISHVNILEDGKVTGIIDLTLSLSQKEVFYDLAGRRVITPQKGQIYIVNNKKVIY